MDPVNQAAILAAGQQLVPDYFAQQLAMQQVGLQRQQVNNQTLNVHRELAESQMKVQRQQQFSEAMRAYVSNPTPEGLAQLYGAFPEYGTEAKNAWTALDASQQKANLTSIGSAAALASKGNYKGAAEIIKKRIDADTAAGHPADEHDQLIYDKLSSENPQDNREGLGLIAVAIGGAVGPEHAKSYLEAQGLSQAPTDKEQQYQFYVRTQGKEAADRWLAGETDPTKLVAVAPGGTVFGYTPGGGGATMAGAPAAAPVEAPAAAPSSAGGARSVRNNNPGNIEDGPFAKRLPGYLGSDGRYARFSTPETGAAAHQELLSRYFRQGRNTVAKIVSKWAPSSENGKATGNYIRYVAKRLNVNPNDTITPAVVGRLQQAMAEFEGGFHKSAETAGGVKKVRSIQEAMKLPSGTTFIDPHGVKRVRP